MRSRKTTRWGSVEAEVVSVRLATCGCRRLLPVMMDGGVVGLGRVRHRPHRCRR